MSSCVSKGVLRVIPTIINPQVRFVHNRPNIQRPRPPPFLKAKFLTVTEPKEPEDTRLPIEKCLKPIQYIPSYELDALDKIYASELRDLFKSSKLSALFHRTGFSHDQLHNAKIHFFKANMKVIIRNKYIVKEAIGDTEFCNLLPLFESSTFMVFSPEADLASLVQVNRRLSHHHLLCAIVDHRILSVSEIETLSRIPNIEAARLGVLQTLLSGAQSVAQQLQSHQNTLVQQLNQRVEQLQSNK